jgi:tetratricopeptide (TPR) repeat protein
LLLYSFLSGSIFIACDGMNVWIGNNEDELKTTNYRFWYYPAKKNKYGYTIWTDLNIGVKFLNRLNPQGGLNEHGLFIDYTAIDEVPITKDDQKKDRKKQVATELLENCKSVNEAMAYLSKYNLVKLKYAQLFIADATGNYTTLNGGYVVPKTTSSFALTNYSINNGHTQACHRRDVATQYLNSTTTFQLDDITRILEKSAQKLPNNVISNYSMAVNLKAGTIYLYHKNDFTTVSSLTLSEELKKGKHYKDIQKYFPESVTGVLENEHNKNGIDATVELYKTLRRTSFEKYNFRNQDAMNLAIGWIEKGQTLDAIKLLECLQSFDTSNAIIYSWLGVANRKVDNIEESNRYFSKALEQQPDEYVATLFGKQENSVVKFKLADFEGAEQVSVIGDFTEWTKNPIKMRKDGAYWTCEVPLVKGEHIYKFIVNKQYLADNKNFMHVGEGPKIYSKLYVW